MDPGGPPATTEPSARDVSDGGVPLSLNVVVSTQTAGARGGAGC
jgi:hypothetical protein